MDVLDVNQLGLVESQVIQLHTTPLFVELVKWCKRSLGKKERKKVQDVVSKYPDMPLLSPPPPPRFPLKCVCPLLRLEERLSEAVESV